MTDPADDLSPLYQEPLLLAAVRWHPVAQQFTLHTVLSREGNKSKPDLQPLDYYVGRMAPERALARALAKECDALRQIREGERAAIPF